MRHHYISHFVLCDGHQTERLIQQPEIYSHPIRLQALNRLRRIHYNCPHAQPDLLPDSLNQTDHLQQYF